MGNAFRPGEVVLGGDGRMDAEDPHLSYDDSGLSQPGQRHHGESHPEGHAGDQSDLASTMSTDMCVAGGGEALTGGEVHRFSLTGEVQRLVA